MWKGLHRLRGVLFRTCWCAPVTGQQLTGLTWSETDGCQLCVFQCKTVGFAKIYESRVLQRFWYCLQDIRGHQRRTQARQHKSRMRRTGHTFLGSHSS